MIIAIAAMCGKIVGSLLADKIGHKRYSLLAILLSIPFFDPVQKAFAGTLH